MKYRFDYRQPKYKNRLPVHAARMALALCLLSGSLAFSGNVFSSFGHRAQLLYTEGDRSSWNLHQSSIVTQYSTNYAGIDWTANISHWKPSGDLRWGYFGHEEKAPIITDDPDAGRLSGRVYLFEPSTRMSLAAEMPEQVAFCRGEVRFREDDQTEYLGTFGVQPHQFFKAEFGHGRVYPFPSYSELYYTPFTDDGIIGHEGGKILWRMPASQSEIKLTVSYYDKLAVSYRHLDVRLLTDIPQYGDYPMGTYTGQLYGGWQYSDAEVSLIPYEGWRCRVRYHELALGCDSLTAHDGGLKFAHFGVIEGSGHIWSYTATYRDYVLEFSRGRAEGRLMGTMQAWPFLRGLYHFLGERRHFIAEGNVRWLQASIKSGLYTKNWFDLDGCLSYLRVTPEMSYVSWRPYLMGMGVDDLRAGSLDLLRAGLARVQLQPQLTWSYLKITLDISQWLPLDTKKASDGIPDGDAGVSEGSGEKQAVWGGFTASLIITAAF